MDTAVAAMTHCALQSDGSYATDWLYRGHDNASWPGHFVGAAYPLLLGQAIYDGTVKSVMDMAGGEAQVATNPVMLSRAVWAGSQRYGEALWSGDTQSTWEDLNQQVRSGLNLMMSGITYWTTDVGGFMSRQTPNTDPGFRELMVRWHQWGAFCPVYRTHGARSGASWPPCENRSCVGVCGASPSNEVWAFGDRAEAAIVKVIVLREQLRPYIMEQYHTASKTGQPIMRPIFYDFFNDNASQMIDDQMMFGPDYMLAPVLKKGTTSRSVYLPPLPTGTTWSNVFTGVATETSDGGRTIDEATPLDTFPLYRRIQAASR